MLAGNLYDERVIVDNCHRHGWLLGAIYGRIPLTSVGGSSRGHDLERSPCLGAILNSLTFRRRLRPRTGLVSRARCTGIDLENVTSTDVMRSIV